MSQADHRHTIMETRLSVYSRCKWCQSVRFLSSAWKYCEQFGRTTVMRQWVTDWRSTDSEGYIRQWKCHPR